MRVRFVIEWGVGLIVEIQPLRHRLSDNILLAPGFFPVLLHPREGINRGMGDQAERRCRARPAASKRRKSASKVTKGKLDGSGELGRFGHRSAAHEFPSDGVMWVVFGRHGIAIPYFRCSSLTQAFAVACPVNRQQGLKPWCRILSSLWSRGCLCGCGSAWRR